MGCGSSGLVSSGGLEFGQLGNWDAGICMVVVVVLGLGSVVLVACGSLGFHTQ